MTFVDDLLECIEDQKLPVRIGLHLDDNLFRKDLLGRLNVVGNGINQAQRIMALGQRGHVLASGEFVSYLQHWQKRQIPQIDHFRQLDTVYTKWRVPLTVWSYFNQEKRLGRSEDPERIEWFRGVKAWIDGLLRDMEVDVARILGRDGVSREMAWPRLTFHELIIDVPPDGGKRDAYLKPTAFRYTEHPTFRQPSPIHRWELDEGPGKAVRSGQVLTVRAYRHPQRELKAHLADLRDQVGTPIEKGRRLRRKANTYIYVPVTRTVAVVDSEPEDRFWGAIALDFDDAKRRDENDPVLDALRRKLTAYAPRFEQLWFLLLRLFT